MIRVGDCLELARELPDCSVDCICCSPPYWGLRDYGDPGAWGLEPTLAEYLARLGSLFEELRRALKPSGTCWVNLGDAYIGNGSPGGEDSRTCNSPPNAKEKVPTKSVNGLRQKNLIGLPWRVAFMLQDQGWYLRSDIVWAKPNSMPESVRDRPTRAHEYVFLLTKSAKYWYDADAIAEPVSPNTHMRLSQDLASQIGSQRANGHTRPERPMKAVGKVTREGSGVKNNESFVNACCLPVDNRNARTVWTIATVGYPDAHFATFPPELPKRCILAGCPIGGTVLDPFAGSGTTLMVAVQLGRKGIGFEINPAYAEMAERRIASVTPSMFTEAP